MCWMQLCIDWRRFHSNGRNYWEAFLLPHYIKVADSSNNRSSGFDWNMRASKLTIVYCLCFTFPYVSPHTPKRESYLQESLRRGRPVTDRPPFATVWKIKVFLTFSFFLQKQLVMPTFFWWSALPLLLSW